MRLHTVFLWVSDLDSSLPWYEALGLRPAARHGGWQPLVTGDEVTVALHEGAGPHAAPTAVPAFEVEDLDGRIAALAAAGIDPIGGITDTGRARFATFADPDGNHVQLLEPR